MGTSGAFEWGGHLSSGGMSEVFEGEHVATGRPVVLKAWASRRAPGALSTFLREARAAARLTHPGVVRVRDFGVWETARELAGVRFEEGSPYVIMDRVPGIDLRYAPVRGEVAVRALVAAALDALSHAHARGVVHRDIKPANVVVRQDGSPVLIDFGLAELTNVSEQASGGTPLYLAPEQLDPAGGYGQGPWTDVYALACVAHELLTGRPPFVETSAGALYAAKALGRAPGALEQAASAGFVAWIDRALAPQPEDRFADAARASYALSVAPSDAPRSVARVSRASFDESSMLAGPRVPLSKPDSPGVFDPQRPPPRGEPWEDDRPADEPALRGAEVGIYALRVAPCVGRRAERARAWGIYDGGAGQRGVEFTGPAGVGKTRLMDWLARRAHERYGALTVRVRFDGLGVDARAWASGLEVALGVAGLVGEAREERLERRLRRLGVADPLGRALVASVMDERALRSWAPGVVARALVKLAAGLGEDLVLALDDVHLSGAVEQVRAAAFALAPGAPLVWVATSLGEGALGVERIDLGPLDDGSMREMMGATLDLGPEVVGHVLERAAGSPMYANQLLLDLIDRGALVLLEGGFGWAPGVEVPVPRKILELCEARIEELSESARDALERAAFLGMSVPTREWRAVLSACELESGALERAYSRGVIVEDEAALTFTHGMWREGLMHRARQAGRAPALHAETVALIRAESSAYIDSHLRVFEHALAMGDLDLAFDAHDYVANWRTNELAGRLLAELEAAVEAAPTGHLRFRMALARLNVRMANFGVADLDDLFAAADALAPSVAPEHVVELTAQLDHMRAFRHHLEWRLEEARDAAARVFVDGVSPETLRSTNRLLGEVYAQLGEPDRAREHLALADRDAAETDWSRGWLLYSKMYIAEEEGDLDEVMRLCDEAERMFESCYDFTGLGVVWHQRGLTHIRREELDQASSCYRRAVGMYELSGDGGIHITFEELMRLEFVRRGRTEEFVGWMARVEEGTARGETPPLSVEDLRALWAARAGDWERVTAELEALRGEGEGMYAQANMLDALDQVSELAAAEGRGALVVLCGEARAAVESRL